MDGFLPIYDYDNDIQNWQRVGNRYGYAGDIHICYDLKLLPFVCPNVIKISGGNTISEFKLQKLKIRNSEKSVVKTYTLSTSLINKQTGTTYERYYYDGTDESIAEKEDGIYQYYIKDSNGNEWISELFKYCVNMGGYATTGDFNDDFNNDFLI